MTAIEIYPQPEQELVLNIDDYCARVELWDVTIYIPCDNHEKHADWLMGFWEQLTDYMAEYADKEHLIEWVERGRK